MRACGRTVFFLGPGLDAIYGVEAPDCGWVDVSLPESASWPERVWASLEATYESLDPDGTGEVEPPPLYERGVVVSSSPVGWGGVRLFGSLLTSVCPDCGDRQRVELPDPGIPECGCGAIQVPDVTGQADPDAVRLAEEIVAAASSVVLIGVPYDPTVHELVQTCPDVRFFGGIDEIDGWPGTITDGAQPVAVAVARYR